MRGRSGTASPRRTLARQFQNAHTEGHYYAVTCEGEQRRTAIEMHDVSCAQSRPGKPARWPLDVTQASYCSDRLWTSGFGQFQIFHA